MTEFRAKRPQGLPRKTGQSVAKTTNTLSGIEKRRGIRLNSRVPVSVAWDSAGEAKSGEAQTRVVGRYGCLVVLPQDLEVKQQIQLTNLVSKESNPAVVVWRGNQRTEGWELGIELINPTLDFWGLEL